MMNVSLLKKDFGLLKETLFATIMLLVLSYGLAWVLVFTNDTLDTTWSNVLAGGASLVRFSFILICALIGGHIAGREQEDSSASFLAQLPISSVEVMRSKLLVSLMAIAAVWVFSMTVLIIGLMGMGFDFESNLRVLMTFGAYGSGGILVFSVAWMASYYVPSAIGASFMGLGGLVPAIASQAMVNVIFSINTDVFFHWSTILIMVMASFFFIAGAFRIHRTGSLLHNKLSTTAHFIKPTFSHPEFSDELLHSTKSSPLLATVWKDFQLMKRSLLLGISLFSLPHLIGIFGFRLLPSAPEYFRFSSIISILMGALVFTFWAAQIMSLEHTSKTAAFSSYLPIPRKSRAYSKVIVTFIPMSVLVCCNLITLIVSHNSSVDTIPFQQLTWSDWSNNGFIVMGMALSGGVMVAFAVAWLLAARYQRSASAIVCSVITVPVVMMIFASTSTPFLTTDSSLTPIMFCTAFGAACCILMVPILYLGNRIDLKSCYP